jgi:hypothetical protein
VLVPRQLAHAPVTNAMLRWHYFDRFAREWWKISQAKILVLSTVARDECLWIWPDFFFDLIILLSLVSSCTAGYLEYLNKANG